MSPRIRLDRVMRTSEPFMRNPRARLAVGIASALVVFGCQGERDDRNDRTEPPLRFPSLGVVLPFSEAGELLRWCDGRTTPVDSLWTPAASDLAALEPRLAERLGAVDAAGTSAEPPLQVYSRQYLGIYRGGRKLVFIQGVHRHYLEINVERDSARDVSRKIDWVTGVFRKRAVSVCDGGQMFFRAEYDVAADAISQFDFNSPG
jgi:hypothetical protein